MRLFQFCLKPSDAERVRVSISRRDSKVLPSCGMSHRCSSTRAIIARAVWGLPKGIHHVHMDEPSALCWELVERGQRIEDLHKTQLKNYTTLSCFHDQVPFISKLLCLATPNICKVEVLRRCTASSSESSVPNKAHSFCETRRFVDQSYFYKIS